MQVVNMQNKGQKKGVNFRLLTDKSAFKLNKRQTSRKNCLTKNCHAIYILSTINALYRWKETKYHE